ncbi:MAG: mannitol dehydrogenase family protein [Endozoicomonas sp.]
MLIPASPAIVHIGPGAFFRAHVALYTDEAMKASGDNGWGIIAASLFHGTELAEQFNQQGCQFTVMEVSPDGTRSLKQVDSVIDMLAVKDDRRPLLEWMVQPAIKIISLTITEKGYEPNLTSNALLQHDLQNIDHPKTAIGLIVSALLTRWKNGIEPFTVMSCDNLSNNGQRVREAVLLMAREINSELSEWIAGNVHFPSTMVDRIVPAMTERSLSDVATALGQPDPCAIVNESFRQWVIEDNFPHGRPGWDLIDGASMVMDVKPFETMKLRMLNGSHSLLAYLGCLTGYTTVHEAISDPVLLQFIRDYMLEEAAPTLVEAAGCDFKAYADKLITRFSNPVLQHRTLQIAMDGSQKISQRWLEGQKVLQELNRGFDCTALGMAAWIKFLEGFDEQGNPLEIHDPLKVRLQEIIQQHKPDWEAVITAILNLITASRPELNSDENLKTRVLFYHDRLISQGVLGTLEAIY